MSGTPTLERKFSSNNRMTVLKYRPGPAGVAQQPNSLGGFGFHSSTLTSTTQKTENHKNRK